jgi:hypothetical protein
MMSRTIWRATREATFSPRAKAAKFRSEPLFTELAIGASVEDLERCSSGICVGCGLCGS